MDPVKETYVYDAYGNPYTDSISVRKPSGAIIVDGKHVADTMRCAHCGGHWTVRKGSGRRRGFCMRCNGVTCGSVGCLECRPAEHRIDELEAAVKSANPTWV